jgi:pseudouridine synthase
VASRRAAEKLMLEGRVTVDGLPMRELGTRVAPDAHIEVDGRVIQAAPRRSYFALHKPLGVVSTVSDPQGRRTVRELIRERGRFFPVGRLDADSSGLLLVTDDGEWAQRVLHPRYAQSREYEVRVRGRLTEERLERLRRGVRLDEGISRLRDVRVVRLSERESVLRVELAQGWKRQVRRTLGAVGLPVASLVRVRFGPLALGKLAAGEYRALTPTEISALAPDH